VPHKDPEASKAYYEAHKEQWALSQINHADARKARKRAYYHAHREEIQQQRHEQHQANPYPARLRAKQWSEAHPERVKQRRVVQYARNPEKYCAEAMEWYYANHEEAKRIRNEYTVTHKEQVSAQQAQWRQANGERRNVTENKRRALKRNAAICDFTPAQWITLKELYQHRCAYCGKYSERLTQDHVMPLSKGGSHTVSNIVPACRSCNSRKRDAILKPPNWPMEDG